MSTAQPAPLSEAVRLVGMSTLARELSVSHQAIRKWMKRGRMPRTEFTSETAYCNRIEQLTAGAVTRESLLRGWCVANGSASEVATA